MVNQEGMHISSSSGLEFISSSFNRIWLPITMSVYQGAPVLTTSILLATMIKERHLKEVISIEVQWISESSIYSM
jgi:hypothetical protein